MNAPRALPPLPAPTRVQCLLGEAIEVGHYTHDGVSRVMLDCIEGVPAHMTAAMARELAAVLLAEAEKAEGEG